MSTPNTTKKKNIHMMIDYLRNDIKSGSLQVESCESIEVAIDCLKSAYGVSSDEDVKKTSNSFFEQFQKFLDNYGDSEECEYAAGTVSQSDSYKKKFAEMMKEDGNSAMKKGDFEAGLQFYTKAIQLDNDQAVYYCNRAAAYMRLGDNHSAISDCNTALRIDSSYSKAYARLGSAHNALKNYRKAREYYMKALAIEPANVSYQNNVKAIDDMLNLAQPPNLPPPFNNPDLFALAQEMFSDPSMNILGRRLAEQICPEIARQLGGGSDQNILLPQNPDDKKED